MRNTLLRLFLTVSFVAIFGLAGSSSFGSTLTCDFTFIGNMESTDNGLVWVPDLYNFNDARKGIASCFNKIASDKPTASYKIDKITTIDSRGRELQVHAKQGNIYHPTALNDDGQVISDWDMSFIPHDKFTVYKTDAQVAEATGGVINYPVWIKSAELFNQLADSKAVAPVTIPYRSLTVHLSKIPLITADSEDN